MMRRRRFLEALPLGVAVMGVAGAARSQAAPTASPGPVSVLDFVPSHLHDGIRNGTNTTTLDSYIQSAIDARPSEMHCVMFPPGTYLIGAAIRINRSNISILGERAGLVSNSSTGDHFSVGDGTAVHSNIDIRGIVFAKTIVATAGFAINVNQATNMKLERLVFYGDHKLFGGIKCLSTIRVKIINCDAENLASGGTFIEASGVAGKRLIDLHVRDCEIYGAPNGFGMNVYGQAEGLYVRRNTFFACGITGVALSGASEEETFYSGKIDQNDFDSCGAGLYVRYFDNISVSDNWFSNNGGTSIWLDGGVVGAVIAGGQIYANRHIGIDLNAADVVVSGVLQTGGGDGLFLRGSATNITVSGCSFSNNPAGHGVNMYLQPSNVSIVGNTIRGNQQGQIVGSANGSNIANNLTS